MRRYSEILGKLLVREQLLLGWKIGFFIVCGALLFASMQLLRINVNAAEVSGTVMPHAAVTLPSEAASYLIVKLDSGETVRAGSRPPLDYRPGERAVVKETATNFFGYKKHRFVRYVDKAKPD